MKRPGPARLGRDGQPVEALRGQQVEMPGPHPRAGVHVQRGREQDGVGYVPGPVQQPAQRTRQAVVGMPGGQYPQFRIRARRQFRSRKSLGNLRRTKT